MLVHNVRDLPQTKLDGEINATFLLNEHGDLDFSLVFAKNSLIKNTNYAKKRKRVIVEHNFCCAGCILTKERTSN